MARGRFYWMLVSLLSCVLGCGASPEAPAEEAEEAVAESTEAEVPEPAPLPKPLMRQAMHCCKNLTMEPVLRVYLALGEALADKDVSAVKSRQLELAQSLDKVKLNEEQLSYLRSSVAEIDSADMASSRKSYGLISEALMGTLEPSQAGTLDLAIAYSRRADAHWFQEGVETKSPYGDGINSYSWGTRDEVKAADEVREKERGSRP